MEFYWRLASDLIETQQTITSEGQLVSWRFKSYKSHLIHFKIFECILDCADLTTYGYGLDKSERSAATKALAEAWERNRCYLKSRGDKTVSSTNGFAAGPTNSKAIEFSRNELIERAVMLAAWRDQRGWEKIKFCAIADRIRVIAFRMFGWNINLFNIRSNAGIVKACLATHQELGAVFDTSFALDISIAENKVFSSIIKNIVLAKKYPISDLAQMAAPEDHRIYYSNPKNLDAFDFLKTNSASIGQVHLSHLDKIQSTIVYSANSMPAVAQSVNDNWPVLTWGTQSIFGDNKWPHPLA